jgi:CBS domain-containing protein
VIIAKRTGAAAMRAANMSKIMLRRQCRAAGTYTAESSFPANEIRGQRMNKIGSVMTADVRLARPDQTIRDAAKIMLQSDVGSLPVGDGDRLIGMVTDRDITLRAVAAGKDGDTPVRDVMTRNIRYCFEDDDVLDVARNMSELGVRRLPVLNRQKRLVGTVALSNIASGGTQKARDTLLEGVATPH